MPGSTARTSAGPICKARIWRAQPPRRPPARSRPVGGAAERGAVHGGGPGRGADGKGRDGIRPARPSNLFGAYLAIRISAAPISKRPSLAELICASQSAWRRSTASAARRRGPACRTPGRRHLNGASLRGCDLTRAYLRVAKLDGADLSGADLRDAVGLTAAQIATARWDGHTRFPPEFGPGGDMADADQVALLRADIPGWNGWRDQQAGARPICLARHCAASISPGPISAGRICAKRICAARSCAARG